jgi:hypothetical protein
MLLYSRNEFSTIRFQEKVQPLACAQRFPLIFFNLQYRLQPKSESLKLQNSIDQQDEKDVNSSKGQREARFMDEFFTELLMDRILREDDLSSIIGKKRRPTDFKT